MDKPKSNKQLASQGILQACGSPDKPEIIEQQRVQFLYENPELIHARFIQNSSDKHIKRIIKSVREVKRLARVIGYPKSQQLLLRCRNVNDLLVVTKRLQARASDVIIKKLQKLDLTVCPSATLNHYLDDREFFNAYYFWQDSYPESPIICNNSIKILQNYQELFIEAHQQNNDLTDYHYALILENYFAYRVLAPERASLILCVIPKTMTLCIDELRLKDNQPVSQKTRKAVLKWLHKGNKILKAIPKSSTK